jgi:PAS domain S-box-containing protein
VTRLPTIVVIDDAAEVRALVRTRIRLSRRFQVVGEGSDGSAAVELASTHQPDLLLLDVSMPGMDGLEALPLIVAKSPATRVVMYSGFAEEGLARRTRELGAAAFFEKSTSLDTLVEDLLEVLASTRPEGPEEEPEQASGRSEPRPAVPGIDPVLQEHLERFREVFEDAAIGMGTMTLTGHLVRANASLAALLGRTESALVGAAYSALVASDHGPLAAALRSVVVDGQDVVQIEHAVSGIESRLVLATLSPVRDGHGRPLYLFLQVQDVTRQRQMEEQLRETEGRFRLLVEAVQDYAIFMLDADGHVASWNAGAQRSKGYSAEEIIGQHFSTFYPPEVAASGHPERELEIALAEGKYEEEGWRVRKDGTRFWAHVTITAVHDASGRHVGFAKVTRDNTERLLTLHEQAKAADELAAANRELEAVNERLARVAEEQAKFLAVTAHELRGPVGLLGMTAETLSQHWSDLDEVERDEFLEGLGAGARQVRRLLADLLMASRLQASALEFDVGPVALADHLRASAVAARQVSPRTDFQIEAADDLYVLADEGRLTQGIDNLLRNAERHGASPVRVRAIAHDDVVDIEVSDAGRGVPPRIQPRLFERFATAGTGGTGLGLFIVRELARAQGGDAFYRSEDQTFVLRLPRAEAPVRA